MVEYSAQMPVVLSKNANHCGPVKMLLELNRCGLENGAYQQV